MKSGGNILHLVTILCIVLRVESQENPLVKSMQTIASAYEYSLDFKNESQHPWSMSFASYDDWFVYSDNLTDAGLTEFGKEYFQHVTLTGLEKAQGVWIAFNTENPPFLDYPFPFIEFTHDLHPIETLEFRYYIHGTAIIRLEGGIEDIVTQLEDNETPAWKTYTSNLKYPSVKFWLMPSKSGDFILIDKIILKGNGGTTPITPTTITDITDIRTTEIESTVTVPPPVFQYILNTKKDSGVPWSFSMHFDGWFSYHESPTDLDLIDIEEVEGVWASFYNDLPPYFDHPSPFIEFATSFQAVQCLELQYYIHGTGNITLEGGVEDVITSLADNEIPTWKIYKSNLTSSFVKLWLKPIKTGDFILIDKIIIEQRYGATPLTTIKTSTIETTTVFTISSTHTRSTVLEEEESTYPSTTMELSSSTIYESPSTTLSAGTTTLSLVTTLSPVTTTLNPVINSQSNTGTSNTKYDKAFFRVLLFFSCTYFLIHSQFSLK